MDNALVSIIVPIFGAEKYLSECVRSLVDQTYANLQIILVDDGSPDNCSKICEEWARNDKRICVIHKENGGVSAARNAGIRVATGQYLLFVDADDVVPICFVEALMQKASGNEVLVVSQIVRFQNAVPSVQINDTQLKVKRKELSRIRGGCFAVERSTVERL